MDKNSPFIKEDEGMLLGHKNELTEMPLQSGRSKPFRLTADGGDYLYNTIVLCTTGC
jgi:hypothetical protein